MCSLSNSNESFSASSTNGVSRDDVIAALQRLRGDRITSRRKQPVAHGFQRNPHCRIHNGAIWRERRLADALVKVGRCCAEAGVRTSPAFAETLALFDFYACPLDGKYRESDDVQYARNAGGLMRAIDMRYWLLLLKRDNFQNSATTAAAAAAEKRGSNIDDREGKGKRKYLQNIDIARSGCCCNRTVSRTKSIGTKTISYREIKPLLNKQEARLIFEAVAHCPFASEVEGTMREEANIESATGFVSVPALWELLCNHNSTLREGDAKYKRDLKRKVLKMELRAQEEVRLIHTEFAHCSGRVMKSRVAALCWEISSRQRRNDMLPSPPFIVFCGAIRCSRLSYAWQYRGRSLSVSI